MHYWRIDFKDSIKKKIQNQNKVDKFEIINFQTNSTQKIWALNQYWLYVAGESLYLLKDKQFFNVIFLSRQLDNLGCEKGR